MYFYPVFAILNSCLNRTCKQWNMCSAKGLVNIILPKLDGMACSVGTNLNYSTRVYSNMYRKCNSKYGSDHNSGLSLNNSRENEDEK